MITPYWCLLAASCFGTLASAFAGVLTCRKFMSERDDARAYAALTIDEAAFYRELLNAALARESANPVPKSLTPQPKGE